LSIMIIYKRSIFFYITADRISSVLKFISISVGKEDVLLSIMIIYKRSIFFYITADWISSVLKVYFYFSW